MALEFKTELQARLENQIRIHWRWLKDSTPENITNFILAIVNNKESDDLIFIDGEKE